MALPKVRGRATPGQVNEALEDLDLGPTLPTYTVATLPPATGNLRRTVHCSNGAAGAPCLAVSDGVSWRRVLIGAAVSATV